MKEGRQTKCWILQISKILLAFLFPGHQGFDQLHNFHHKLKAFAWLTSLTTSQAVHY